MACAGAFLIGMWTALLALVCLVMWGILSMWLGDSNKSSSSSRSEPVRTYSIGTGSGPLMAGDAEEGEEFEASDGYRYRKSGTHFVRLN